VARCEGYDDRFWLRTAWLSCDGRSCAASRAKFVSWTNHTDMTSGTRAPRIVEFGNLRPDGKGKGG
jgi:hypothetical protein